MTTSWWDSSATFRICTTEKVSFIVLNLIDLMLTLVAMSVGFDELNPLVGFLLEIPALFIVAKVLLPPLLAWLIPGRLLWPSIALLVVVAVWNITELIAYLV